MENNVLHLVCDNDVVVDRCHEFDAALDAVMEIFIDVHPHDKIAILEATKTALIISTMVDFE